MKELIESYIQNYLIESPKEGDSVLYGAKIGGKVKVKTGTIEKVRSDGKIILNTSAILDSSDKVDSKDDIEFHHDFVIEEVKLNEVAKTVDERNPDYHMERTKDKIETIAHPNGKPVYNLFYKDTKIGVLEPYSGSKEKRKPGSRIVSSRKHATFYRINWDKDMGPEGRSQGMDSKAKHGHAQPKHALNTAANYHKSWAKKNMD